MDLRQEVTLERSLAGPVSTIGTGLVLFSEDDLFGAYVTCGDAVRSHHRDDGHALVMWKDGCCPPREVRLADETASRVIDTDHRMVGWSGGINCHDDQTALGLHQAHLSFSHGWEVMDS